jgi:hypothetical protein
MRSAVEQSVGVDISKDALDVAIHPSGELPRRGTILKATAPSSKGLWGSISPESFSRRHGLTIACSNRRSSRPARLQPASKPLEPAKAISRASYAMR